MLQIGHLASISFLAAVTTTSIALGFPLIIIFTCAAVICLKHTLTNHTQKTTSAPPTKGTKNDSEIVDLRGDPEPSDLLIPKTPSVIQNHSKQQSDYEVELTANNR